MAWSTEIAITSEPSRSSWPEKSAARSLAVSNSLSFIFVPISQAEAALTISVFALKS
jgi:hypothetical protein